MDDLGSLKRAYRGHAKKRIKERYNVDFSDADFRATVTDIKAGRHFEHVQQMNNRIFLIMNMTKLGANVPLVFDRDTNEIVTVLPRPRKLGKKSFKRLVARHNHFADEPVIDPPPAPPVIAVEAAQAPG